MEPFVERELAGHVPDARVHLRRVRAGLETEDVQALIASVIAEDLLRQAQAGVGQPQTEPVARGASDATGDAA